MMMIIFLIDSIGPFDMVAAFSYVGVVAISGETGSRRWILSVASGCGALTVLSYVFFHGLNLQFSLESCLSTLVAIYIVSYFVMGQNETKNKLQSQKKVLDRSQALFEITQSLSSTGSISFSLPSMDMEWSAEAKQIFGFDSHHSPLMGDLIRLTHVDHHDLVVTTIQGLCRQQSSTDAEFRIILPDRKTKMIRLVAKPLGLAGDFSEITVVLIDVTFARECEDRFQERQTEIIRINRVMTFNEIIASIAHEVNQPLAAVVTSAQSGLRWLNRSTPDIAEVELALLRVAEQTNRAGAFMSNLRGKSLESVRVVEPVCIRDILKGAEVFMMRDARLNQVDVRFHIDDDIPVVAGDLVQIQHVVMNLVSNSIESLSLSYKGVRQVIVLASRNINGDLSVSVRDSGGGIRSEDFDKLFTPFFTTKINGVGVGLAICRSIIEAHGGRIWAGSERHSGTVFSFSLPQLGKVSI
ncbi:sensor histidine kinase [Pseudomonas sp. NFR16]|uniref:sensor histidine kinase n=1 Tax=Pseudomonas sp. NFR16 TaxID=1566248 RepID=UPI0015A62D79|nr:ATP-binding protein [Pseudomonas sp. NFR16]